MLPVKVPHTSGYVRIRGLYKNMIMVRHQAICRYAEIPYFRGLNEKINKHLVIMLVNKYLLASPDAWYHVMNRGRRGEEIFTDQHDYQMFVDP